MIKVLCVLIAFFQLAFSSCYLSAQNYLCVESMVMSDPKYNYQKAGIKLTWSGSVGANDTVSIIWGNDKVVVHPIYGATDYLFTDITSASTNSFKYELVSYGASTAMTVTTSYFWGYYN